MKTIRYLLILAILLATVQISTAAVPSTINYQGRLTNTAGVPQPGTHSMSLKIYDAATTGAQLYAETIGNVTVDANGVYSFQFGATGISAALAVGVEHWLELTVDSVVQTPRQKILAVPFAMKAANADQAAMASDVVNGSITAEKLSGTAVTDSLGNAGNIIAAKDVRNDLIAQGFLEIGLTDVSTVVKSGKSAPYNTARQMVDYPAVWTGTELIIYGGYSDVGACLDTGASYNPSTDIWKATSNGPKKLNVLAAVWTGTEVIFWGESVDINLNVEMTGARYNPTTNTWTSISNGPAGLYAATAVWSGTEMILWGDQGGARYNPSTNAWGSVSTTNAPLLLQFSTAVWTGTEMVVWGSLSGGAALGGRYNPITNTWRTVSTNALAPQSRCKAFWTGSVMIISSLDWDEVNYLPDFYSYYNPVTNVWTRMTTVNASGGLGVWTGSKFLTWYDFDGSVNSGCGASYDFATHSWTRFLSNNIQYVKFFSNDSILTWIGDRLMLYHQGNITFVRPAHIHLYAKP